MHQALLLAAAVAALDDEVGYGSGGFVRVAIVTCPRLHAFRIGHYQDLSFWLGQTRRQRRKLNIRIESNPHVCCLPLPEVQKSACCRGNGHIAALKCGRLAFLIWPALGPVVHVSIILCQSAAASLTPTRKALVSILPVGFCGRSCMHAFHSTNRTVQRSSLRPCFVPQNLLWI